MPGLRSIEKWFSSGAVVIDSKIDLLEKELTHLRYVRAEMSKVEAAMHNGSEALGETRSREGGVWGRVQNQVLTHLREVGHALTVNELATSLKANPQSIRGALDKLAKEGVKRAIEKRNGALAFVLTSASGNGTSAAATHNTPKKTSGAKTPTTRPGSLRDQVLAVLADATLPLTAQEIGTAIGRDAQTARFTLKPLKQKRLVRVAPQRDGMLTYVTAKKTTKTAAPSATKRHATSRKKTERGLIRGQVLDALQTAGHGMTVKEVATATGYTNEQIRKAVSLAEQNKLLTRTGEINGELTFQLTAP